MSCFLGSDELWTAPHSEINLDRGVKSFLLFLWESPMGPFVALARRLVEPITNAVEKNWLAARPRPPRMDPRLPPFDPRQTLPWRSFFRRLALHSCCLTIPAVPVHDCNGDLVAGWLKIPDRVRSLGSLYSSVTGLALWWYIEGGFLT